MKSILHIFNGDASYLLFRKNEKLTGDCLVWREMLIDGRTTYEIGSDAFWESRMSFFEKELGVDRSTYSSKTIDEFESVDIHQFHEIILWFEYDLFCQVNCLAMISFLFQQSFEGEISVVNLLSYQEKPYTALGELKKSDFPQIFNNRRRISQDVIEMADMYWFNFCSENHEELLGLASMIKFPFLEETTKLLQERFNKQCGITYFERILLEAIGESVIDERKLLNKVMIAIRKEGYGDVQVMCALKALKSYYQQVEAGVVLNSKGIDLLNGKSVHTNYIYPSFIGGKRH